MAYSTLLRIPKPKTFLYLMSLRFGTELISLTHLVNKITGLYGLLAILTGLHLSPVQLSMYLYSLIAFAVSCTLVPHIRKGPTSPFHVLALAWLYLLDSAVNALYTAAFGVTWFLVLAQHTAPVPDPRNLHPRNADAIPATGSKMMDDAAGFTNPKYDVDHVDVHAKPAEGFKPAQDAELVGHTDGSSTPAGGALSTVMLQSGSVASIVTISALWAVRIYFILVVMAYARQCLRQYVVTQSLQATGFPPGGMKSPTAGEADKSAGAGALYAENPFERGTAAGEGWKGALGRVMVRFGRSYWLGADEEDEDTSGMNGFGEGRGRLGRQEWAKSLSTRFEANKRARGESGGSGVSSNGGLANAERERRRRAGTGPPAPVLRPIELGEMGAGKK